MTAQVQFSPIGNAAQFFSVNGTPLNAGTLATYAAGSTTPTATFTSSAGDVANANPIVLGVDGRPPQEIWLSAATSYKFVLADSLGNIIATYDNVPGITGAAAQAAVRSYLAGLGLSTAGGSATMTVAAGQAVDTTNAVTMSLAAAMGKTTAAWSAGNTAGGLDVGVIANSTWYHFFLIYRSDTGAVDVLFSLSPTTPTMPANYTNWRRIGSGKTTGGAQWTSFIQDGDLFQWATISKDIAVTNPGNAAVTRTMNVPTGVNVQANVQIVMNTTTFTPGAGFPFNVYCLLSDLAVSDEICASDRADVGFVGGNGSVLQVPSMAGTKYGVRTNTSGQFRSRLSSSDANTNLFINTISWIDRRGRDA